MTLIEKDMEPWVCINVFVLHNSQFTTHKSKYYGLQDKTYQYCWKHRIIFYEYFSRYVHHLTHRTRHCKDVMFSCCPTFAFQSIHNVHSRILEHVILSTIKNIIKEKRYYGFRAYVGTIKIFRRHG